MPNHFHMVVVTTERDSLAALMKCSTHRYAQLRNGKQNSSGKLFEGRFRSKVVDDDAYLHALMLYNDTNAYRSGIVRDPAAHAWSTIGFHAGQPADTRIPRDMWTPSGWYLSLGDDEDSRVGAYRELVADYLSRGAPAPDEPMAEWAKRVSAPYRVRVERPDRSSAR